MSLRNGDAPGSQELYCNACNRTCVVMSRVVECFTDSGERVEGGAVAMPNGATRFGLRLRPYQIDRRFVRHVEGAKKIELPSGEEIEVREFAAVCSRRCSEKLEEEVRAQRSSWTMQSAEDPWPETGQEVSAEEAARFGSQQVRTCGGCRFFQPRNKDERGVSNFIKLAVHEAKWRLGWLAPNPDELGRCGMNEQTAVGPHSGACDQYRERNGKI